LYHLGLWVGKELLGPAAVIGLEKNLAKRKAGRHGPTRRKGGEKTNLLLSDSGDCNFAADITSGRQRNHLGVLFPGNCSVSTGNGVFHYVPENCPFSGRARSGLCGPVQKKGGPGMGTFDGAISRGPARPFWPLEFRFWRFLAEAEATD